MPYALRKIRKAKWYKHDGVGWLVEGDLQADALDDLRTTGNKLSVYSIDDDRANLEQVAIALATAKTDYLSDFEYALFNLELLSDLDIQIEHSEGNTPDAVVNSWHRDLVELTSKKVMALATVIQARAERKMILKKSILTMVLTALESQQLDRALMKAALSEKLDQIIESTRSTH